MEKNRRKRGNTGVISRRQQSFVAAYIEKGTITDACKETHTAETTAYRWLDLPQVQAYYRQALDKLWDQAMAQLQGHAKTAASTIVTIMQDELAPQTPRLKAAFEVLDRLAASRAKREAQGETMSGLASELLPYLTFAQLDELAQLNARQEEILEEARVAKIEKEGGNITPIRRVL